MPAVRHGLRCGAQRLRRHLAAEQPGRLLAHDDGAEQVVLDPLEREQLGQPGVSGADDRLSQTRHGPLISQPVPPDGLICR